MPPCACAVLYDPGGISASRDGEAPTSSAPITSVADSHDNYVEARSHGFALPVYASQPTSPPDHATLGTGWVATPCRAGPSPAEALHEVSALLHMASSSSVFIWRTVIETAPVERDEKEPHPLQMVVLRRPSFLSGSPGQPRAPIDPDVQISGIVCGRQHTMRYVASPVMWRGGPPPDAGARFWGRIFAT